MYIYEKKREQGVQTGEIRPGASGDAHFFMVPSHPSKMKERSSKNEVLSFFLLKNWKEKNVYNCHSYLTTYQN